MVGVAGKYKGCNTCRLRRVKCDNIRPFCQKCADTGRECAGYQRERVFIIGTPDDLGRCSSHPRRAIPSRPPSSKSRSTPSRSVTPDKRDLTPVEPPGSAWNDVVPLQSRGAVFNVRLVGLNTSLDAVVRRAGSGKSSGFRIEDLPAYAPLEPRLSGSSNSSTRSVEKGLVAPFQCMVHISPMRETHDVNTGMVKTESVCAFLYEESTNANFDPSLRQPWDPNTANQDFVHQRGPAWFTRFPNHHFFSRIHRPNAIGAALLSRKGTYLSSSEWISVPWDVHPKSTFDKLLDIVAVVTSILARADGIVPFEPTLARRVMAQDLLGTCVNTERALDAWHLQVNPPTEHYISAYLQLQHSVPTAPGMGAASSGGSASMLPAFWIKEVDYSEAGVHIPFGTEFAFRDATTALMLAYYWTALILLYPTIEKLHEASFQPVADAYPQLLTDLPHSLQIVDSARYAAKEVRALAASVCRALDFALSDSSATALAQPDLLAVPLAAAEDFYRELNAAGTCDTTLELLWCDAFRARLAARTRDVAEMIRSRPSWVQLPNH